MKRTVKSDLVLALLTCLVLPVASAQSAPHKTAPTAQTAQTAPEPTAQAQADPRRTPVVRVVQEAGPAVVSIISAREVEGKPPFAGDTFMQRLFGDSQNNATTPKPTSRNLGSGVIIDGRKGYVLTNAHVISGGSQITARLYDGREYQATLQGAAARRILCFGHRSTSLDVFVFIDHPISLKYDPMSVISRYLSGVETHFSAR